MTPVNQPGGSSIFSAQRCLTRAADAHAASHVAETDEEKSAWLTVAETWLHAASKVLERKARPALRVVADRQADGG
jgi:hypothetical protein